MLIRLLCTLTLALMLPLTALAASPTDDVRSADNLVQQAAAALASGDVNGARQTYTAYRARWREIEDGVRDVSPDQYAAMEAAQRDVRASLLADPADVNKAASALATLHARDEAFVSGGSASATTQPAAQASDAERLATLIVDLDAAQAALGRHDTAAAARSLDSFQRAWPGIEGLVKAKSAAAYTATEDDLAIAQADVANPAKEADASAVVSRMRDRLEPIVQSGASYGVFDAFIIMLREGLEALLVVGALSAFVKRSNAGQNRGLIQIWGGAAAGVALSIVVAFVLQQIFSRAGAGFGTELVEGFVGLFAAVMLFYVSYWLHSKARLGAWQKYIRERSTAAMASGGMLSLALIAFLAVFREGAETAVFYLGIAPSIAPRDLVLGLAGGVAVLVVVGVALLLIGMRLPLRPFFLGSSLLIYYLGFKFLGTGLHALQVAGVLPATPAPVPSSDLLGVYPTWQTVVPQLALLLAAVAVLWLGMRARARTPGAAARPAVSA